MSYIREAEEWAAKARYENFGENIAVVYALLAIYYMLKAIWEQDTRK